MIPFLYNIAKTYYQNHKTDISDYVFVFPNRRSGLFFQKYLGEIIEQPIFSPKILTINELFMSQSNYKTADKLGLLFRIYNIFKQQGKSDETFDSFAYWGEMLLGDYDDADKYLVNTQQLFTNVKELKEIDNLFDYLNEEQIAAIRTFWTNFIPTGSGSKQQEFISTWEILYPIYEQLRKELKKAGLAYEGMIFRDVIERINGGEELFAGFEKIIFVGFNALTPCEKSLFKYLKKRGKADFYWDYFSEKTRETDNLASLFYQENVYAFPSQYEIEDDYPADKHVTLTGIPSAIGQTKEVYQILKSLNLDDDMAFKTAVVLPEEKYLLPLLHSLPADISNINVTMGYPLSFTPLAGLVDYLFELQRNVRRNEEGCSFYYKDVLAILNHQYIYPVNREEIKELIDNITRKNRFYIPESELGKTAFLLFIFHAFEKPEEITSYLMSFLQELHAQFTTDEDKRYNNLEKEFIYHYYITLKRTDELLREWKIEMNLDTFFRLLRKLTSGINIPFTGEPLSGLQIMGVLETRAIDFENLIITSMNEGIFPKRQTAPSFIPYNLRKGFGMPTSEHQDSIFAYHFYRLIHRAKNIYFLYDTRTDGLQTGEVSRFIHQLRYHYKMPFREKLITYNISLSEGKEVLVEKTPDVMEKLALFLTTGEEKRELSASAINMYLDCPLKFYFSVVEKLSESDEVKDNIEANDFGTIFHAVMQYIYDDQRDKYFTAAHIEEIRKNNVYLDGMIRKSFANNYLYVDEDKVQLKGQYHIIASIIKKYVRQLLKKDMEYAPFHYVSSEFHCHSVLPICSGTKQVNLHGYIDRIDEKDKIIRIIDYKTGTGKYGNKDKKLFNKVTDLFDKEKSDRPKEILQLFMYSMVYQQQMHTERITPAIIFLRNLFDTTEDFLLRHKVSKDEMNTVDDFNAYKNEFEICFTACLEEIFNPEIPFRQSESNKACQYCIFTDICKK